MTPDTKQGASRQGAQESATVIVTTFFIGMLDIIGWASSSPHVVMWATVALQATLVVYGYRTRPAGLLLTFFVMSTFTFLTGRMFVVGVLGYQAQHGDDWGLHLNDPSLVVRALVMQQVFLLGCWSGTSWFVRRSARRRTDERHLTPNSSAIAIGMVCVVVGVALYLVERVGVVAAVNQASYLEYYAMRASLVSPMGRLGESLLVVGYAFTLAGLPRFRTFALASAILLGAHGYDLLMGRRAPFVLSLLLVLFYSLLRSSMAERIPKGGPWPRAGQFVLAGLGLLPLLQLLNFVNRARWSGVPPAEQSSFSALPEFLYSQGVTANLLVYVQTDLLQIPTNRVYTFGPLVEFVQSRLLPGFDSSLYDGQTADRALLGHNFADIVSYRIMPSIYLNGGGYGSSGLAELYWDFGWIGIVLGAVALGVLFFHGGRLLELSVPLAAAALIVSRQVLYVPRAPYLDWLVGSANVFNLAAFAALWIGWKLLEGRRARLEAARARRGERPRIRVPA